ncbi:Taurine catabolism dioxygenase TauD, TfdA family [compost metagenome]|jgi:hypothetical protein
MKIWFHCVKAAPQGGETSIADSRNIYRHVPAAIRERFEAGLPYVRNVGAPAWSSRRVHHQRYATEASTVRSRP